MKILILLFISCISGLLGSWAGSSNTSKSWRRFGIPLIICIYALFFLHNGWVLTIMFMSFALSMGYGIPDIKDSGSGLGRFWVGIFPYHVLLKTPRDRLLRLLADIFTRGTVATVICISLLSIPLLKGTWLVYVLCSLGIKLAFSLISWRDLGTFKFGNKQLAISEFWTYFGLVFFAILMIK